MLRFVTLLAILALASTATRADEIPRTDSPQRPSVDIDAGSGPKLKFGGLIGLSAVSAGEYAGSDQRSTSLRPLAAIRYGRFRLSTSGSSSLLNFGTLTNESGASVDLFDSSRWRLRAGLRISGGRSSSDSDELAGLPDVRKTLLARAAATYRLTPEWSLSSSLHADALGRGNGLYWSNSVDWRHRLPWDSELRIGAGATVGNAAHLAAYYGVPRSAQTSTRPAYSPGAGLKDAGVGLTLIKAIDTHWIAFAGTSYTRLLGPAADSPLALRKNDYAVSLGVAWRWRD